MHIQDIFKRDGTTFSFEFFPPKNPKDADVLFENIQKLEELKPSFVSVTYGAGGSTRDLTHEIVTKIMGRTNIDAIPHLTCVGHQAAEIAEILDRYAAAGVSNILALGGDPPKDMPNHDRTQDAFRRAGELVRFIRNFPGKSFGIGVAGFPEGHPATPNRLLEMDHLKAKVDEGADYICTQLFFDNRDFYDFRERCELAGIKVPILAGIMPVSTLGGMKRMAELALGARFPARLQKAVARCGQDQEAVARVGVLWATEQCRDLLDNNVAGIHFYTLNKSDATRKIFRNLGVRDSLGLRASG